MKAKIKKTGEIINIAEYAQIALEKCDSYGNPISVRPEDVELIPDVKEDNFPKIDWEQRRYEIAREMLPSIAKDFRNLVRSGNSLGEDIERGTLQEYCTYFVVKYADALIKELKRG